jgi:hypothetical protein
MTRIQIAQHVPGGTTCFYQFQASQPGGRYRGVVVPLNDPARASRVRLKITPDRPKVIRSLATQIATGSANYHLHTNGGQSLGVTASRLKGAVIYRVTNGQVFLAGPGEDDDDDVVTSAIEPVTAVLIAAGICLVAVALVGIAAVGGDTVITVKSDEGEAEVGVDSRGEGEGDGEGDGDGEGGEGEGGGEGGGGTSE